MRTSLIIVVLAASLLGIVLLWMPALRRTPPTARPQEAPAESEVGGPALQREPSRDLEPQGQEETRRPAPAAAEPDPASAEEAPPHPSSPEYAARLAERFDADPPDVSRELERDIATWAAALMPAGSRIDSIECRQMLCRVRSLHPDKPAYDAFIAKAFADPDPATRLWIGQAWIAVPDESMNDRAGTRIVSVVYLQRDPNPAPRPF